MHKARQLFVETLYNERRLCETWDLSKDLKYELVYILQTNGYLYVFFLKMEDPQICSVISHSILAYWRIFFSLNYCNHLLVQCSIQLYSNKIKPYSVFHELARKILECSLCHSIIDLCSLMVLILIFLSAFFKAFIRLSI